MTPAATLGVAARQRPGLAARGTAPLRLILQARAQPTVAARVEVLSGLLLGHPYEVNPLRGSPDEPETLSVSLERFDCVTYVETVLALALSSNARDFPVWLRRIRYEGGHVAWRSRNHYMTGWIRANVRLGVVRRVLAAEHASRKERRLDVVPGLPPRPLVLACIPKTRLLTKGLQARLRTADLIFFASTRRDLDVFHCGLLVESNGRWLLRHAARGRGRVVEEDFAGFLRGNRMAGAIVVRPGEGRRAGG